jgi:hypothetical protein
MVTAASFLTNDLVSADKLKANVIYEAMVLKAVPRTFNDGTTKLVLELDNEQAIVSNQTRLHTMIEAGGMNYERWAGLRIRYWRDKATFEGREVPAIKMEVIVSDKIAAEQRQALDAPEPDHGTPEDYVEQRQTLADDLNDDIPF